ncbi:hypothetical protein LV164_001237 [Aspergillus fumigatus]|nr:hypothetical protein CNMCM8057_008508 [Aspergillus fumigatus]KAF4287873.1 hypothetical protein CNMCM8689_007510 [Aspergillus fumigatus]KAF4289493.1 hypothetical protein CNMCM8686_002434 [Aspergillus fumigatus]KAH1287842.1 hypothetical protein KXX48_009048 [Aspergillus fumigatus]KAH1333199.1 hypothetical protein KXX47_000852 [Aspergillus fumigatus]
MQFDSLPLPPSSSHDTTSVPPLKRHAACDECRKRKLKCSGEATGCSRCLKQSLPCHYSLQKPMGRPPKKRPREDNDASVYEITDNGMWADIDDGGILTEEAGAEATAASDALRLCPPVYTAPMRMPQAFPNLLSTDDSHNHLWQLESGRSLDPIPATTGPWPDFSSVTAATSSPFTLPSSLTLIDSPSVSSPSSDGARAVIRCEVCPTSFALGMQNVMFTGTLLNVIADAWLRVSQADAEELGKLAAPPAYVASVTQNSPNPAEAWKDWLRQTVRSAITGGPADPAGQVKCSDSPTLLSLIEEMEARQHRWHRTRTVESPNEPGSCSPVSHEDHREEDMLCFRVIRSARDVIAKFEFAPHEYPEGVVPV